MCSTIILVAPARAGDTGAVARMMKIIGFTQLYIVDNGVHPEPITRWVTHGSDNIIDNTNVFPALVDTLHNVDFTVATTARSRVKSHYYATSVELVSLLQEKSTWMGHAALVFGREDSGLTNEELTLADVLTGVLIVADYPPLSLGQTVMVYRYQLAGLIQQPARNVEATDELQLQALRTCILCSLATLNVSDDIKLTGWLQQRMGLLGQRDTTVSHRSLHDIERNITR